MKVTDVPVVNLKDDLFLIGLYKFNLELKGDFVSLQIGSQYHRFADYIKENRDFIKNKLTILSLKNEEIPIVEVVNRLIHKQQINGFNQSIISNDQTFISRFNQSFNGNASMRGSVYSSPSKLSSRVNLAKLEMTSPRTIMASPIRTSFIIPKTVAQSTRNLQDEKKNRYSQVKHATVNLNK